MYNVIAKLLFINKANYIKIKDQSTDSPLVFKCPTVNASLYNRHHTGNLAFLQTTACVWRETRPQGQVTDWEDVFVIAVASGWQRTSVLQTSILRKRACWGSGAGVTAGHRRKPSTRCACTFIWCTIPPYSIGQLRRVSIGGVLVLLLLKSSDSWLCLRIRWITSVGKDSDRMFTKTFSI